MMQFGLIGIGAGAAAALLFASVTSSSWLSVLLFYLSPLPIMIAGLGWSHWAALAGALVGAIALTFAFGGMFFFAFMIVAGLPAWWLGYLAMLARPATAGGNGKTPPNLEWYPAGRLVAWAAALATMVVLIAISNVGVDMESFRAALQSVLSQKLRSETATTASLSASDVANAVDLVVTAIPPALAVVATIIYLVNLWLAGRIVKFSDRLARPWPQLSNLTFPRPLAAALAIAIGLSFAGGLVGIVAGVLAASLLVAYSALGFAVLHSITRGIKNRGFVLGSAYASAMIGWPILAVCLLGLVETIFDLRALVARKRGPPPPLPT